MKDSNYIKIYTGEFIVVQRIVSALKKINISPVIKDAFKSGLSAVLVMDYSKLQEVFVNKDELDNAVDVVENITSEFSIE